MIHVYSKDGHRVDHRDGDEVVQQDGEHRVLDVDGSVFARYRSENVAATGGARGATEGGASSS